MDEEREVVNEEREVVDEVQVSSSATSLSPTALHHQAPD